MSGSLVAVNVGGPHEVWTGKRLVRTSIWKSPVEGRVAVRGVNIDGDEQSDLRVHGGPDKAIYAYASEDTAWWEAQLGRELGPGAFGENLTTSGIDVTGALVGERWAIGTTLLEVSQPRLPCFKLGLRMEDPLFPKRFTGAGRPGAYLRILLEGELGAGDAVDIVARPEHDITMAFAAHAYVSDHAALPRLLEAGPALAESWRADAEYVAANR